MKFIFITMIVIYKKSVSPLFPSTCRYTPTCSEYSLQAIKKYGAYKGLILSFKRVINCHPWSNHGDSPIP